MKAYTGIAQGRLRINRVLSFLACAVSGCVVAGGGGGGSGGGGGDAVSSADVVYQPPANLDHWVYALTRDDGTKQVITARVAGTKTIGGAVFARLQVGVLPKSPADPNANYIEAWAQPKGTAVVFAGGEIHNGALKLPPGTPDITLTVDPPVTVETNVAVGVAQAVTATGTLLVGDPATAKPVTGTQTGTFQLVATDESVDTGIGVQSHAAHYSGAVTILGQPASGELWMVSGTGVVKAVGQWPGMPGGVKGVSMGLAASGGSQLQGANTVASQESLLTPTNPTFSLDTYDLDGGVYADKTVHANLLLELRWADPEKAKTAVPPAAQLNFGTAVGYYPTSQVDSPVSILHPEDNGKGYHFWTTLVNQAAKNESGAYTSYHIKATLTGAGPVRATGQLTWHSLKPSK